MCLILRHLAAVAHDARGSSQSFPLLPTLTQASPNCRGLTRLGPGSNPRLKVTSFLRRRRDRADQVMREPVQHAPELGMLIGIEAFEIAA